MKVILKTKHPLYWTWRNMLLRCSSTHPTHFSKYGKRQIKVCERWHSFELFVSDMGNRPAGMSIDRIDNDGNYEPGNCRWADRKTQSRNRRGLRMITFRGRTQMLSDWSEELGIKITTLSMRIDKYGWSIEKALTEGICVHAH